MKARLLVLIALFFAGGCDRSADTSSAQPAPTVQPGPGIVRGIVRFIGTVPAAKTIGGECCPGSPPVEDESLSVSANGSMKNVVVSIKDGPNVAGAMTLDALLTQRGCRYEPHVTAIRTGQNLVITSHDPTLHNVHIEAETNPSDNFSELEHGTHTVHFQRPEAIHFKCDVHPWMSAYVHVFDHPCFAVTDDQGRFEIPHLPAGTYTLQAWQEKLGTKQMQVTVTDKPTDVTIEYHGL